MRPVPPEVVALIRAVQAPPRLAAHLIIVHDVAATLVAAVAAAWPQAQVDQRAVLIGAATHDLAKARFPEELTGPGRRHENQGPALLVEHGLPAAYARFARTHGQWAHEAEPLLEDLLVALADTIWKGKRNARLEDAMVRRLAEASGEAPWETFLKLDDILQGIADEADGRLAWELAHEAGGG
jgi:hypothetical protein